jgi:hypothetical protein
MLQISIFLIAALFFTLNSSASQLQTKNVAPPNIDPNFDMSATMKGMGLSSNPINISCTSLFASFGSSAAVIITKNDIYYIDSSKFSHGETRDIEGVKVFTFYKVLFFTFSDMGRCAITRGSHDLAILTLNFRT